MLQTFLPVFAMTFFICLFIVLMQFLFRYVDDMVGKGLDISVIAELFFYAALTMVPMALPLAILLASLMTFGNLGEKFELTAMKASGVSLLKTMRPLILLVAFIAVGAFFFQNNVMPIAQTKMWTLLYSMRQKSPEMEINEKVFSEINGYNFYVDSKNKETGELYQLIIYDTSKGFENSSIILADSGRIDLTADKNHFVLSMHSGEQFENIRNQKRSTSSAQKPYRRESFDEKIIIIPFDANFNRMDESTMRKQYIGKNIAQLQESIDSLNHRIDSIGEVYAREIVGEMRFGLSRYESVNRGDSAERLVRREPVELQTVLDIDSIFTRDENLSQSALLTQTLSNARQERQSYEFRSYTMGDDRKSVRRHSIEMHKKFTLSFACLIFFFIGAPLGAIIKKGGLGFPLLVSVILFIVYYIIDNTGYKMARDGRIEVYVGMWISSAVLLPLGIYLTYKAMKDSSVVNIDFLKRLSFKGRNSSRRELEMKSFTMTDVVLAEALVMLQQFDSSLEQYSLRIGKNSLKAYFVALALRKQLKEINIRLGEIVEYLSNSRSQAIISALNSYPYVVNRKNIAEVRRTDGVLIQLLTRINQE